MPLPRSLCLFLGGSVGSTAQAVGLCDYTQGLECMPCAQRQQLSMGIHDASFSHLYGRFVGLQRQHSRWSG